MPKQFDAKSAGYKALAKVVIKDPSLEDINPVSTEMGLARISLKELRKISRGFPKNRIVVSGDQATVNGDPGFGITSSQFTQ